MDKKAPSQDELQAMFENDLNSTMSDFDQKSINDAFEELWKDQSYQKLMEEYLQER